MSEARNPNIFDLFGCDPIGDIQGWFCEILDKILAWFEELLSGLLD